MGELDVWVHRDGWAGHTRTPGVLLKRNPKRSLVRFDGQNRLVPNYAITERTNDNPACQHDIRKPGATWSAGISSRCVVCGEPWEYPADREDGSHG